MRPIDAGESIGEVVNLIKQQATIAVTPDMLRDVWGDPDDPYTKRWHERPRKTLLERFWQSLPPWQSPDAPVMPKISLFPRLERWREDWQVWSIARRARIGDVLEDLAYRIDRTRTREYDSW